MSTPTHILITAGPTHERIDDVRYLANRSSGRMGMALAEAALGAGCQVTLLLGPVAIDPTGLETIPPAPRASHPASRASHPAPRTPHPAPRLLRFTSTADLQQLLDEHFPQCDVLIMAAAVADYRPIANRAGKLPRRGERLVLELEPTPDLVAGCAAKRRAGQRIIAFALEEPSTLAKRAVEKMEAKGVDAIVANPLETMGSETVNGVVYTPDGQAVSPDPPRLDKRAFAEWLIQWLLRG